MQGSEGAQQDQCGGFDLIHRLRTIHRTVEFVRVVESESSVAKLMHCLSAY